MRPITRNNRADWLLGATNFYFVHPLGKKAQQSDTRGAKVGGIITDRLI